MSSVEQTAPLNIDLSGSLPAVHPFYRIVLLLKRKSAWIGFLAIAGAVFIGWVGRYERNIRGEDGLGYTLGIMGASMMLIVLIYPLRKRIRWLRIIGSTRNWFKIHMILGVIAPILILYHCNFSVSSLNSRVALFCTLLVACSGIVGRYLYAQIHSGLYGEKIDLRSAVNEMQQSLEHITASGPVMTSLMTRLGELSDEVLEPPKDVFHSARRPFKFAFRTRWEYLLLSWKLRMVPENRPGLPEPYPSQSKELTSNILRQVRQHFRQVRRVAHLSFFERLFSLWHILHLPFFLMLVVSATVHIFAVHMY